MDCGDVCIVGVEAIYKHVVKGTMEAGLEALCSVTHGFGSRLNLSKLDSSRLHPCSALHPHNLQLLIFECLYPPVPTPLQCITSGFGGGGRNG